MPKTLVSDPETHSPRRSRFSPDPLGGLRLRERDEAMLCDLYLHGAMARGQIETLYFSSVPRCNARLRQLFDHGLVTRHYLPAAPFGAQAIYGLGRTAAPRVAARLELDPHAVRKACRERSPTYLEHTLAIVDFRIALHQAARERPEIEVERWMPEILCRHAYEIRTDRAGGWKAEVFKPDAFVRLFRASAAQYLPYFVEVDLGHTSSSEFAGKLRSHQRYLESGLFAEIFGNDRFTTLTVTTGPGRLAHLVALAEREKSRLFWFTTFDAIRSFGAFGPVWRSPFEPALRSLV